MSRVFMSLIIVFALISCKEESVNTSLVCGKKEPTKELDWLINAMKNFRGGPEVNAVVLYQYQNKEVLELQGSVFSSTNIHQYYCNGQQLDLLDPIKYEDFKRTRVEKSVLYGTKIWN